MARILIAYASIEGQAARVAARIADRLGARGHAVERRAAAAGFEAADFDAVVIGASVHYGSHPRWLRNELRRQSEALAQRPAAFYSVSVSANPQYARDFLRQAGWEPRLTATFAGALRYSQYAWWKRRLVQAFALMGGHSTDTSRDHEYTDWDAVARFADSFGGLLAARA